MSDLFLPFGNVGRGTWWLTQIVTISMAVIFLSQVSSPLWNDAVASASGHHLSWQEAAEHQRQNGAAVAALVQSGNEVPWAIALLVAVWIGLMVEINRWHDRGMSGFWVLLRLFPPLLATGSPGAAFVVIVVTGFQIVQLGFLGSAYAPLVRQDDWRDKEPWWKMKSPILLITLAILAGLAAFGGYRWIRSQPDHHAMALTSSAADAQANVPGKSASIPSAAAINPTSMTAPVATALPDSAYHGTAETNFGKDWVVLNGEKIQGIAAVIMVPGAEVSILNANGGKTVPVAQLPQGFLDEWKVTPDRLKAENAL